MAVIERKKRFSKSISLWSGSLLVLTAPIITVIACSQGNQKPDNEAGNNDWADVVSPKPIIEVKKIIYMAKK